MKRTLQCYECKEQFLRETLINYTSENAKNGHNYCPECLKKVQAREQFVKKVCEIFNINSPGPRLWTERKRLINTFGYTDQTIVECLDYLYKVKGFKVLSESLCLIKPPVVEEMLKYKRKIDFKQNQIVDGIIDSFNNNYEIPQIKIKENNEKKIRQTGWDSDDYLYIE